MLIITIAYDTKTGAAWWGPLSIEDDPQVPLLDVARALIAIQQDIFSKLQMANPIENKEKKKDEEA